MYKKHFVSKVVLLTSVIVGYGMTASAAPAAAASTEQPPKTLLKAEWADKIVQLEAEVAALETRLHKERHAFSKMGENNYKIFQLHNEDFSLLGNNLNMEGDVNNDGYDDILISESLRSNGKRRVFFFYGGKDIDFSSPDLVLEGENENDSFGDQSGVFGDVNNDGCDDVIIGARGYGSSKYELGAGGVNNYLGIGDGRVYIYYGGSDMDNIADVILDGEEGKQACFGLTVTAGDVDNDGYADILVGAQMYDHGRGRVYLFWGGETMDTTADVILEGEGYPGGRYIISRDSARMLVQGWFGRRIDASGDVNGDGYRDILVGARCAGGKESNGAAYLFFGNTKENMDAVCDYTFRGEDANDEMGASLEVFDIDSDGFDDVIVGARFARNWRGAVYIWWGGENFNGNRPADIVLQGEPKSNMGGDNIICDDFNNDGYGDILAGAYNYPQYPVCDGRAYVFYGNERALMDTECDYIFDPEEQTRSFGFSVSTGDANNDGYLDALISAQGIKESFNGKAFLYFGPFASEDLQDKIKAQQEVVRQVETELSNARVRLNEARKSGSSSTGNPSMSLHEAVQAGNLADVKSFISKGADVNEKDNNGLTALHHAAIRGHKEIVEVLLAKGADVNAGVGDSNMTAAEFAMWSDRADIVELLIAKGADVSALHLALHMKDQAQAKSLIEGGADVNKRTQYGTTPLHMAATGGFKNIIKLLIDKGADVNAKTGGGETPLDYAMQAGHRDIAELLLIEQTRPLSGDLAQIALARKRLQPLTNHATPFEEKLLDMEGLLAHLNIRDLLSVGQWDSLKGVKIKAVVDEFVRQNKQYFTENPEPQSDEAETQILSLLKNAINEFLEAGRILDESDAAQDDDASFSKMLDVLGKRQEVTAQRIFTRLIKNLSDRQDNAAQLEAEVSSLEARLHKERHEFSKMGENNYKVFQVDTEERSIFNNVRIDGDVNNDGFNDIMINETSWKDWTGRRLFFYGGKDINMSSPDMVFEGESEGDSFGGQSGMFADINSDGYDDIVIGAYGYNNKDGRVYIYFGGPDMDSIADAILDGEKGKESYFGLPVATEDIDNDGYVDILVGAQMYDKQRGRAYLFWGGETIDTTADVVFEGEAFPEGPRFNRGYQMFIQGWFGRKIDVGGDVNGDGYYDILIGARHAGEERDNGGAYLFLGDTKENMDAVCDSVFRGRRDGDEMGSSLDLFDIDNDGFSDVIVGARNAAKKRGEVYIWWGGKDLDGNRPADIVLQGEIGSCMSGGDIECGDFNNDGYGDILVGAAPYPYYPINNGRAYVFYGNDRNMMDTDCDYIFDPEEHTIYFGVDLSVADINNDGYMDALIGAEGTADICNAKAFLYFGPFATEDLQAKIKAQQEVVKEVEKEVNEAKQELNDARKARPSSTDPEKVSVGLPESLRRFLTPELEELHDETVASLNDGSFVLRDGIRENTIWMTDVRLSSYIDELKQAIEALESQDNKNDQQKKELEQLREKLSWFDGVKYVPQEERETKKSTLREGVN